MFLKSKNANCKLAMYTLRQWCILFAIIFLIITSVTIILSILGLIKSDYGWRLIKADIAEEQGKRNDSLPYKECSNQRKLCESIQSELMKTCVFYLCCWIGLLNFVTIIYLLYGLIRRCPSYLLPWIIVSMASFGMALFTLVVARYDSISTIDVKCVVIGLASSATFYFMWNTIFMYFTELLRRERKLTVETMIKAYGGYTHTLKPAAQTNTTE